MILHAVAPWAWGMVCIISVGVVVGMRVTWE